MSPDRPFFSIIIPCYNYARFLPDAVRSVAAQDYDALEAVIVNDGSPDNTEDVALALVAEKACPNLQYLEQANQGPASARNNGIAHTRGDWVVCLDSDDMLAEGYLAAVAAYLRENPHADAVSGAYREFGARESEWTLTRYVPERLLIRGNIISTTAFRRALWHRVGGFSSENPWGAEDWHFWVKSQIQGFRFAAIPVPMIHYRVHEAGSRSQNREESIWHEFIAMHHTMTPGAYPPETLRKAHAALLDMSAESEAATRKKLRQLPDLALPHFWLGLAHEGRGETSLARQHYREALKRPWPGSHSGSCPGSWQAEERLAALDCGERHGCSESGPDDEAGGGRK